jgi:hypothetical protein
MDPAAKDRRFVILVRAGIDRDVLTGAHVARAEPEFLAKYAAEMGVADEAILVGDFADAAGLARIVEQDVDRREPALANIGGYTFGVGKGTGKGGLLKCRAPCKSSPDLDPATSDYLRYISRRGGGYRRSVC